MYMAPEQFNGAQLDEKIDVYAMGCIMNEIFTRRQPWQQSSNFFQVRLYHLSYNEPLKSAPQSIGLPPSALLRYQEIQDT